MALRPYSSRPLRFVLQLISDLLVLIWVIAWIKIGQFVDHTVHSIAQVGYGVQSSASDVRKNLNDAGHAIGSVPLIGDKLSSPLTSAGGAAGGLSDSGRDLGDRITSLAIPLALVVALLPVVMVVATWGSLRWRFARRAGAAAILARQPGGQRLLALRAMSNQPVRKLLRISADPVAAWTADDHAVTTALAALELRQAGVRVPAA